MLLRISGNRKSPYHLRFIEYIIIEFTQITAEDQQNEPELKKSLLHQRV